jgi:hypothetical protein
MRWTKRDKDKPLKRKAVTQIPMTIYADDIAAPGRMSQAMQERIQELADGCEQEADIVNRVSKCKVMHCVPQQHPSMKVSATTEEDCKSMGWNFHCIGCARPWPSATSLKYHELKCRPAQQAIITNPNKRWAGKWEVEEVLAVRGPPGNRFWHVKWKGWAGRAGTDGTANTDWEPERNLAPAMFHTLKPSFAKL